jgi:hypothetical protein
MTIRTTVGGTLLTLALTVASGVSSAASTAYDINFTVTDGGPAPTGSFIYDPNAGFSDFIVNWDGNTVDLTSAANNLTEVAEPSAGGEPPSAFAASCGVSGPQLAFDLISSAPCISATSQFNADRFTATASNGTKPGTAAFEANATIPCVNPCFIHGFDILAISGTGEVGPVVTQPDEVHATMTVTAVPLPPGLGLLLVGGAALGFAARRRQC